MDAPSSQATGCELQESEEVFPNQKASAHSHRRGNNVVLPRVPAHILAASELVTEWQQLTIRTAAYEFAEEMKRTPWDKHLLR